MNILIVDDNEIVRTALSESLKKYGECTLCDNGDTAVAAFEKALQNGDGYSLILMDIMMPGLNGLETLRKIRQLEQDSQTGRRAKAFMLTAVSDGDKISEAYGEAGASAYLTKPVHTSELIDAMIENHLIRRNQI